MTSTFCEKQVATKILSASIVLLANSFGGAVLAQDLDTLCPDAQSTVDYGDCLNKLIKDSDGELERLLKSILEKIERADYPEAKQRQDWRNGLSEAQRKWLAFRQEDCGVVRYEYWGGSGTPNFMMLCQLKHTRDRIDHLQERYDVSDAAEAPSYPFLGRWATKPLEQTESLSKICSRQIFGHLEITSKKVNEYESDCDIKNIEKDGEKFLIQSACFAEGEEFSELKTIEMLKDGRMRIVGRIPKWGQKTTRTYQRCQ